MPRPYSTAIDTELMVLPWLTSMASESTAYGLGMVLVWGLAAMAAFEEVLGGLWRLLIPLLAQVVTWILLGLVMVLGSIIALFSWSVSNLGPRLPWPTPSARELKSLPDLNGLAREARFDAMARYNGAFYRKELTAFVSLQRTIRLVQIQPGRFEDPLVCRTVTMPLIGGLDFVALSYAWGEWDDRSQQLSLDGKDGFCITWNAYNALRRLRAKHERRSVWIDAICIDQSNHREKSSQIQLMGAIYQRAQEVFIYLGPCRDTEARGRQMEDEEVTDCRQHMLLSLRDGGQLWLSEPSAPTLWWWRRAWTVQETVVATNISVLLGPHTYTWREICHTATYHGPLPTSLASSLLEVDDLRASWQSRKQGRGLVLSELLARTAMREATRPLDRVFSVLAMKIDPSGAGHDIVADYDMSAPQLDLEATRYVILQEQSLDIFICNSWMRYSTLSWSLKFTDMPNLRASPLMACRELLDGPPSACMRLKCQPSFRGHRLVLGHAAIFDEIVFTIRPDPPHFSDVGEQVTWIAGLSPLLYQAACDQVNIVAREIETAPLFSVSRSFSARLGQVATEWNRGERVARVEKPTSKTASFLVVRRSSRPPAEFVRYARHCAQPGRTFFVTRLGFVGIAYPPDDSFALALGQTVVVVHGTRMPLIVAMDSAIEHKPGRLIAPAYVSCLMNEELARWGTWERRVVTIE